MVFEPGFRVGQDFLPVSKQDHTAVNPIRREISWINLFVALKIKIYIYYSNKHEFWLSRHISGFHGAAFNI